MKRFFGPVRIKTNGPKKTDMAPGRLGPKWTILALAAASDLVFVGAKLAFILGSKCSFDHGFFTISVIFGAQKGPRPGGQPRPQKFNENINKTRVFIFSDWSKNKRFNCLPGMLKGY